MSQRDDEALPGMLDVRHVQPHNFRAPEAARKAEAALNGEGVTMGWERYVGRKGLRFGVDSFGASAPVKALYNHFGLTADTLAPKIIGALN